MDICTIWHIWDLCYKITPMEWYFLPFRSCWYYLLDFWQLWMVLQSKYKILTLLRIKVWRTNCFPPVFEFWTTAEVVNNVGAKIQISLNVYCLTEIDRLILNFQPGDFFQHSSCVSIGHRKYKYANEICLLCLFTELGAVCLQFREDPKSTNRVKKISKNFF